MKKSCHICEKSIEVKYIRNQYGNLKKHSVLFCISGPPIFKNRKNEANFGGGMIVKGKVNLNKYSHYPIVSFDFSEVAPCFQYCKTEKKETIKNYEKKIEEQKEIEKKKQIEEKKVREEEEKVREKIKEYKEKVKREKEKQKKMRKEVKRKRNYQKAYRARKKEELKLKKDEKVKILAEELKLDSRFDILDL